MWTEVQNPRRFLGGEQNRVMRGTATFSLHKHGMKGWILKSYNGKHFVLGPYMWNRIKKEWNSTI